MKAGVAAMALLVVASGPAWGQGIRISGVSTAQYIDMRPVALDSVPVASAPGDGLVRVTADSLVVTCEPGESYCQYMRPTAVVGAVPLIQDIDVNAWGFLTGLRAYAQLRARAAGGAAGSLWPSANDRLEALAAYLELDRGSYLARVGRQWVTSGLGFYDFDGGFLEVRPRSWLTVQGFAGRSLVRGDAQPLVSSAIAAVEPWAPDEPDWLLGAQVKARPTSFLSVGAIYQRDIRRDMAGLYSERVATDATAILGRSTLSAGLQADLASRAINDGRVRIDLPRIRGIKPAVQFRHYQPFFELWTIWGAFSPVGYDELTASAAWTDPAGRLSVDASVGRRRYGTVTGGMASLPLTNDGWRTSVQATYRPDVTWTVNGGYSADVGFGESRSDQTLGVRRRLGTGYLGVTGTAFQTLDEFQVDRGRVWGLSADGGVELMPQARLDGSVQVYRHAERYTGGIDWNQLRGLLQLQWTVGRDPGMRVRGGVR